MVYDSSKTGLPGSLSQQQVLLFRRTGFLRLPWRLTTGETDSLLRKLRLELAESAVQRDVQDRAVRIDGLVARNPDWLALASTADLLDALASLLGPNIVLFENRHNHGTLNLPGAPPGRLHRDVLQWSRSVLTVLIYLEDASVESGCTEVIPGSHLLPFVGTPNNGGTWMDEHSVYADLADQALPIPMPAGAVLALDALAFHRAGINRGLGTRAAITFAYTAVDELAIAPIPGRRLVRGELLYRGNHQ